MQVEEKWWAVFPAPQRTAPVYPNENLLRQFNILQDVLNAGTLLIDVRRNDYEGT
jgi:arsenical-resistance protein 2